MKLYNRTRIADDVLHALLAKAGRAVGARTSKVVVVVKPTVRDHGRASSCIHVRTCPAIVGRGRSKRRRWISTDGGYIELFLQRYPDYNVGKAESAARLAADLAQRVFDLAMHEWGHIADFQANDAGAGREFSRRGRRGRRPTWGDRPEEIRAEGYVEAAKHAGADDRARRELDDYAAALAEDWRIAPARATVVSVGQDGSLGRLGHNALTGAHGRYVFGWWSASLAVEGTHVGHARIHAGGADKHEAYLNAIERARIMGVRCEGVEMQVGQTVTDYDRTRFREFVQARSELEMKRVNAVRAEIAGLELSI